MHIFEHCSIERLVGSAELFREKQTTLTSSSYIFSSISHENDENVENVEVVTS